MRDVVHLRGHIELELSDIFGRIVERRSIENTVVTAGKRFVLEQLASSEIVTSLTIGYLAIGSGTAAPATSDSALGSETTRKAIGTFTTSNLTSNPPSWRAEVSFSTAEGNTTLGEAALLNSSAAGTMLARGTYSTINKTTTANLTVRYTVSAN